jgi:hypothetical protein
VSACDHHRRNRGQKRNREDHSAGLGEPKPLTEPPPIAFKSRHALSLGRTNERHPAP